MKKKDGSLRMCIDYRQLTKVTIKNKYPLRRKMTYFIKFKELVTFQRLRPGYHKLRVREVDISKIKFRTINGNFEFLVVSFVLINALRLLLTL